MNTGALGIGLHFNTFKTLYGRKVCKLLFTDCYIIILTFTCDVAMFLTKYHSRTLLSHIRNSYHDHKYSIVCTNNPVKTL